MLKVSKKTDPRKTKEALGGGGSRQLESAESAAVCRDTG